jgi:hypothetical protein
MVGGFRRGTLILCAVCCTAALLSFPFVVSNASEDDSAPSVTSSAPVLSLPGGRPSTLSQAGTHADAPLRVGKGREARRDASSDCLLIGSRPPVEHFAQVQTYVGPVPADDLRVAGRDLIRSMMKGGDRGRPNDNGTAGGGTAGSVRLFALDGTLLNAMRWGRIVNDNDIDVGVIADGIPLTNVSEHYFAAMWALARGGFIDAPSPRLLKRMWDGNKLVKPGRCVMRPQMMQCRHRNGVIVDLFGPETVFSSLTRLGVGDVFPTTECRFFDAAFPCPANSLKVLKSFTMQFPVQPGTGGARGGGGRTPPPPRAWYEFAGCALLPPKPAERDAAHAASILRSTQRLHECGYPSLFEDRLDPECQRLLAAVGLQSFR